MSLITVTYNRAHLLETMALPSVLEQESKNFEWIIVNDGRCELTRKLIEKLDANFPVTYLEMDHLENGFSLCAGKNLAIEHSRAEIIGYIDDDNRIYPSYTSNIVRAFKENKCSYLMAQQNRWKYIYESDQLIRREGPHLSPISQCELKDLVIPNKNSYFDSNGFAHLKKSCPQWDTNYRVFCDYTYLLNSIQSWGEEGFHFLEIDLVDYIQTTNGVIGTSNYSDWAQEFKNIWEDEQLKSSCDLFDAKSWFPKFIAYFEKKAREVNKIEGFQV